MAEETDAEFEAMREADAALAATTPEAEPEPEIDAAAEPEPAPQPAAAQYEQRPDPGYVPLAELQKERARRREMETRLNQLMGRVEEISKARAEPPPQPPAPALPEVPTVTWEENPAEYLRQANEIQARKFEGLEKDYRSKVDKLEAEERQAAEQRQFQERDQQFVREYQEAVAPYLQQYPELREAYQYNRERRAQELMAEGLTDIGQVRQQLEHEEKRLAFSAMQQGVNPAEAIWRVATTRGYRPTATPTAAVPERAQPTARPAAVQPSPSAVNQQARNTRLAAASRSLSSASGAATAAPSISDLASMSQKDFDRLHDKNPDLYRQAMGG